jgi:hypothetical protein
MKQCVPGGSHPDEEIRYGEFLLVMQLLGYKMKISPKNPQAAGIRCKKSTKDGESYPTNKKPQKRHKPTFYGYIPSNF